VVFRTFLLRHSNLLKGFRNGRSRADSVTFPEVGDPLPSGTATTCSGQRERFVAEHLEMGRGRVEFADPRVLGVNRRRRTR
jgi:hypothetical protein